ncbi:NtaA/DmoA family FMN-dependent monooxygenase [Pseudoroseomonas globiformis]|uniref:NtaA/DmoA family FMN-dependent monooxygenase n=1 Tax=Teichococcus globiformis TaxID=2307229 RepID=A0ABV7G4N2_9PROT
MKDRRFHLGWFLQGSSVQAWGEPWTGNIGQEWMQPEFFTEMTRNLERACFDYVLIEDSSYVGESFGGTRDVYLRDAIAVPRQDPSVLATILTQKTRHIGIVPTFATFAYPPYLLARLVATLDQVSNGRIGWNAVTGSSDFAARNFGLEGLPEHDLRYDMADEYMQVVNGLWGSWEPGALLADTETGVMVDPTKVHAVNHEGRFYKSRGPLNSGPCVQGRPVIAQAGGSPRGRQFAAQHADTIVASIKGTAGMKAYRDDIRARMAAAGRDPDSCKVLFLISPIIGDTEAEAWSRKKRRDEHNAAHLHLRMAHLSKITNIDFSALPLDEPLGKLTTNGHQQSLDEFLKRAGNKTLREAMAIYNEAGSLQLIGTPEQIADRMGEAMDEVGGDGFLFSLPDTSRRSVAEVADGLVPALQKRGLMRRNYAHDHFRDNLLAF